jgi:phosphate transport system substrate-binding protein
MSFNKNDKAVSPVVATLVLIVVAIIGAAAVGALLGAFSGTVGQQANAQGTGAASSTTLSVVGSTTMQPASQFLSTDYEAQHQGVQINIQGGGSGAGITAVGQGVADIGSASRAVKDQEMTTYPTLKTFEIGACAACFIENLALKPTITALDQGDIVTVYSATAPTLQGTVTQPAGHTVLTGKVNVYTRSDSSGTKDTVFSWLGADLATPTALKDSTVTPTAIGASGSQAMEDAVAGDAKGLGYVDYGFACGDTRVYVPPLTEEMDVFNRKTLGNGGLVTPVTSIKNSAGVALTSGNPFNPSVGTKTDGGNILSELQTDKNGIAVGSYYPEGLIQPLYYITNGAPNTLEQNFIDFARSPNGDLDMKKANYFGLTEYK